MASASAPEQEGRHSKTAMAAESNDSLKLAIAMALLRSKLLKNPNPAPPPITTDHRPPSAANSNALKWKRKAKERKQEILRLKQDLKEAEDGLQRELFPGSATCKCFFFENLGALSIDKLSGDAFDQKFNDVLCRRFIRQVRLKQRRKRRSEGSSQRLLKSDYNTEEETEQLRASVDFLVELCDTMSSPDNSNFASWSHQALDFILAAIKNLSSMEKNLEPVEGIIGSLTLRLVRRMCTMVHGNEIRQFYTDAQFCVQHLLRKLGREACIGQRVILAVSQRISLLAESLLFIDPFESTFPEIHSCLYLLIQLVEFLVSDYLISWSKTDGFDTSMFEEWVTSILHARKGLELLENRCGLYILYMDRVIGLVAKQVGQLASLQKLNPNILQSLFC